MSTLPGYLATALLLVILLRLMAMSLRVRSGRKATIDVEGEPVEVAVELDRSRAVSGHTVGIRIEDRLRFSLVHESWLDRLAKDAGVAREWQTGDADFDARIFIGSEDALLLERLSASKALRAQVLELIGAAGRIECSRGKLTVTLPFRENIRKPKLVELRPRLAARVYPALKQLRAELLRILASDWEPRRDPARRRQLILSAAAAVCGTGGFLGYFYLDALADRQLVYAVTQVYALWSLALISLAFVVGLLWLRVTPYTHRVLLDVLLAAIPGSWFASMAIVGAYNVNYDTSPPETRLVHVGEVYTYKVRHGVRYHLVVQRWPDPAAPRDVDVRAAEFAFMHRGGCVLVNWHRGRIGDGWVSDYRRASCTGDARD